jgi:hypothetical protein
MLAFLVFRPNIKVEPTSTMNSSDPFSEEFRVINDGAFEITQVHYACAITFIDSGQPDADTVFNESNPVMVPIAPHVNAIERNGSSGVPGFFCTSGVDTNWDQRSVLWHEGRSIVLSRS